MGWNYVKGPVYKFPQITYFFLLLRWINNLCRKCREREREGERDRVLAPSWRILKKFNKIYKRMSLLSCPWPQQFSRDVRQIQVFYVIQLLCPERDKSDAIFSYKTDIRTFGYIYTLRQHRPWRLIQRFPPTPSQNVGNYQSTRRNVP